MTKTTY